MIGCKSKQTPINKLENLTEEIQENAQNYTEEDWKATAEELELIENEIEQLVSDIKYMKQQGMKKVAIITKNNAETKRLYEELKPYFDRMGKVEDSGRIVRGDVDVMPS